MTTTEQKVQRLVDQLSATLVDFRECVKAVEEDAELSDAETSAMLDLVTLAAKLVRIMTEGAK